MRSWWWRRWRHCCWWLVLAGLVVRSGHTEACPPSCLCSSSRISCVDPEGGISSFPWLQSEAEMENITDM